MRIFEAFFERANSLFYSDLRNERRVGVGKEPPGAFDNEYGRENFLEIRKLRHLYFGIQVKGIHSNLPGLHFFASTDLEPKVRPSTLESEILSISKSISN